RNGKGPPGGRKGQKNRRRESAEPEPAERRDERLWEADRWKILSSDSEPEGGDLSIGQHNFVPEPPPEFITYSSGSDMLGGEKARRPCIYANRAPPGC
ncbi:unnamed protein product, partial [Nesidiocoris tenuis]